MGRSENLIPLKKGYDPNRNYKGRPKKFITLLKEKGYKVSEINDTIQILMSLTLEELIKIDENPNATVLEKTIASAIKKGISKGNLENMETLLNRVYGKPKEKVDITTNGENINGPKIQVEIVNRKQNDSGSSN